MLLDLAHEWVGILNDEAAAAKMTELRTNLPQTWFAWSGGTTNGGVAYYRIQGPTVMIEYAPQQGDLDHIHTIYRDPSNDYGAGLVKKSKLKVRSKGGKPQQMAIRALALVLLIALPTSVGVAAHRLDEYLQAARVGIGIDT